MGTFDQVTPVGDGPKPLSARARAVLLSPTWVYDEAQVLLAGAQLAKCLTTVTPGETAGEGGPLDAEGRN